MLGRNRDSLNDTQIYLDYKYLGGGGRVRRHGRRHLFAVVALVGAAGVALALLSLDAGATREEPTSLDIVDRLVEVPQAVPSIETRSAPEIELILLGPDGRPRQAGTATEAPAAQVPSVHSTEPAVQPEAVTEVLDATPFVDEVAAQTQHDTPSADPDANWVEHKVRSGDTLSVIFSRVGIGPSELSRILAVNSDTAGMTRLRPGQTFRFQLDDEGRAHTVVYELNRLEQIRIVRGEEGFEAERLSSEVETRERFASATINSSLYAAASQVGLSDAVIMQMANIFGWDVDFALDIRQGDRFSVLYEERLVNGERIGDGPILVAEFVNRGRTYRAVRYTNPEGHAEYFTPEGTSMRRAFLRAPLDFRRISSRFQPERYHPVLGVRRPHRGVDYAAPTGTPIWAAGDGRITFQGRQGGYGNTVIIRHNNGYETLYAHLNGFRRGLGVGSQVRQGDVIGYVGMTGLATGPHLHYEFRVNGVHRDPLTVRLPDAEPVPEKYRADFLANTQRLIAQLEDYMQTQVAQAGASSASTH